MRTWAAKLDHPFSFARLSLSIVFSIDGAILGNWVARVPDLKGAVGATSGTLGLALAATSVGAFASKLAAGQLIRRLGSASAVRVGIILSSIVLPCLAGSRNVQSLAWALFGLGIALGVLDVSMNAHAVMVERQIGRSVMAGFHGLYSVGGLFGALVGSLARSAGLNVLAHFSIAALIFTTVGCVASIGLSRSSVRDSSVVNLAPAQRSRLTISWRREIVLLGLVGFCSMLGEGAVADWGALYFHENLRMNIDTASMGYVAFTLAMTSGRLFGDRLLTMWGSKRVAMWSLAVAGAGFDTGLVIGTPAAAVLGFLVLGAGLALIVPVTFSLAGVRAKDAPAAAIATVSSISGTGYLVGPALIGIIADNTNLALALGLVGFLAVLAAAALFAV